MTRADFRGTEQLTDWSPPARVTGPTGADGQTGNHYALIFIRSAAQPAAPTGNTPAGWSDAPQPPDGNPLWMSRGIMNTQGVLQGTWSRPVQIEHEGRGILSVEIRFQRTDSATPPAMPPEGQWGNWLEDAPALDGAFRRLWKLERITFTSGTPATQDFRTLLAERGEDGMDGLGIDALPADAYAYWSCDDLPEIPDNPAGAVYRNDAEWTRWGRFVSSGHPDTGAVTREGGVLVVTGTSVTSYNFPAAERNQAGDLLIVRARQTEGALGNLNSGGNFPSGYRTLNLGTLTREWRVYRVVLPEAGRMNMNLHRSNRATVPGRMEISDLYVGDGSYISPLLDSARDNHATMPANGGVIPAQGRFGRGLEFLGGAVTTPIPADFFTRDFTISMWINPSEWNGIILTAGGRGIGVDDTGELEIFGEGLRQIPLNAWTHVVARRRGGDILADVNGERVAVFPAFGLLSGGFVMGHDPWSLRGLIDEIALFNRALTDSECTALYHANLSLIYGRPLLNAIPEAGAQRCGLGGGG